VVVVMDKSNIKSLAELKGKKLGIQSGSSANVALDAKADFKSSLGEVVSFKDNMTALMDLETGGLDAVLLDSIVAGYNITMSKKPYRILSESLGSEKYGIGFRKNDVALRDAVNAELKKMADDGSLARISTKWFTKDITTIGK
ncbi:MAG: transporter substrate-binding domain-containing protein, partial [Clostridia bacterium]